jgi:lipopolysaccharide transport system permease protein
MHANTFYKIISNKPNSLFQSFKSIFSNKFVIYCLLRKNIILSYSQSFIGAIYFLFLPLLQTIIFSFFLNNIFALNAAKADSFIFILISMTCWNFVSNSIIKCSNCYLLNKRLITKVYFDRLIFFIQSILFSLVSFIINLLILFIIIFLFIFLKKNISAEFSFKIFFLPFFIIYSCFFFLFIGIIISSISIRFRDLLYGLAVFFQIILFMTPVLYSLEKLNGLLKLLMTFNPFTFFLEIFRWFFYSNYNLDYKLFILNFFYFLFIIFFSSLLYKKSNLILSDEI